MILRFVLRRVALAALTLFAVSVATFALFFAAPANPAEAMCGKVCPPERVAAVQHRLGLDEPLVVQYREFVAGIFFGRIYGEGELALDCPTPCLGYSFVNEEPVTDIVARRLPVTASIVLGAAVLWLTLGVALGVIAALHRGTLIDRVAIGISLAGASMQVYFLGMVLLLVFRYWLRWVPVPGYVSPFDDPLGWAAGMILPWCTLGFLFSAIYARLTRAQLLETLSEDFIRTARAKGLPNRTVHLRHGLRASLTPIVTIAGLDIGAALGGTFLTETVFSMHGLGRAAVDAVKVLNLPVIMATVLLAAFFVVLANLVVDLLYAVIDPRVRAA